MDLHEIRELEEQNKGLERVTTDNIGSLLDRKKTDVLEGNDDAYKLMLFIKKLEEKLKSVKNDILEVAVDETTDKIEWNGYRFENTSSGRYNYDHCLEWTELKERMKTIEKNMQIVYKSGNAMFDNETGEEVQPAEFKPSKKSVKITKYK